MRRLGRGALVALALATTACGDDRAPVDLNGPWQSPARAASGVDAEGEQAMLALDDAGRALLLFTANDTSTVSFVARGEDGTWGAATSLGDGRRNAALAMNAEGVAFIALAAGDRVEVLRKTGGAVPELVAAIDEAPLAFGPKPGVVVAPDGSATVAWDSLDGMRALRVDAAAGPSAVETLAAPTSELLSRPPALCVDAQGEVLLVWDGGDGVFTARWSGAWGEVATITPASVNTVPLGLELACNAAGEALLTWIEESGVAVTSYEPTAGWGAPETLAGLDFISHLNVPSAVLAPDGDATLVFPSTALSMWALRREGGSWGEPIQIEARDGEVDQRPFSTARLAIDDAGAVTAVWAQTDPPKAPDVVAVRHVFANRFVPSEGWGEAVRLDQDGDRPSIRPVVATSDAGTLAAWEHFVLERQSSELWVSAYEP